MPAMLVQSHSATHSHRAEAANSNSLLNELAGDSTLKKPSTVENLLKKTIDRKSFVALAAAALGCISGIFAGLATAGILTTPLGWSITGATLVSSLVGIGVYGDYETFEVAAFSAAGGFLFGLGAAAGIGTSPGISLLTRFTCLFGLMLTAVSASYAAELDFSRP